MTKRLYIAYGADLNKERMERRCPTAKPIAVATLPGYRLVFQGRLNSARANVIPENGQEVPVVIWELSARDERNLDVYKGIAEGNHVKEYMEVEVNGEVRQALIYTMEQSPYGTPTDRYLQTMAEGYKDFGLPIAALNEAVAHACEITVLNEAAIHTHEAAVLGPAQ